MKGMKTSRDYIKDDLDLLEASTSFIKGDGYKEKILEDIEEFAGDGLTDYQKGLVREMAKCDYECGGCVDPYDESFKELLWEDEDLCDNMEEAQDYYQELADMGPAGFYEEFQDEFDWDPDFVAQYGDNFEEEDDYFEEEDLEESHKPSKKRMNESFDNPIDGIIMPYTNWSSVPLRSDADAMIENAKEAAEELKANGFTAEEVKAHFDEDGYYDAVNGVAEGNGTWDRAFTNCILANLKESKKNSKKRIKESLVWASMDIGSNNSVTDGMEEAYDVWCQSNEQSPNDLWLADAEAFKEGYRENHRDAYTEDELETLAISYFDQLGPLGVSTHWDAWVAGWTAYPIHGVNESKKRNKKSIKEKRITSAAKTPTEWFKLFNNIFLEIKDKFPNLGVSKDWDGKFPAKIFIDKLDLELQFDLNYNGGYYSGSMRTYFGKLAWDGEGEPLVAWNSGDYEEFETDVQDAIDYLTNVCESRGSKVSESKKKGKKSIKENASDMDVYIVTPDWDQYPCDEHGNPDGWDPREEAEYFTKLENAALACGMQTGFIPFSDGDAESGMCAPETDGTWQATPAMLRQFIEEYDLPIKVYEQGIDGEVGEEIFDYQSLAFDADPIEQDDEVRDMGEMYGVPRGASSEEALKFFESKKSKKKIQEMNIGNMVTIVAFDKGNKGDKAIEDGLGNVLTSSFEEGDVEGKREAIAELKQKVRASRKIDNIGIRIARDSDKMGGSDIIKKKKK